MEMSKNLYDIAMRMKAANFSKNEAFSTSEKDLAAWDRKRVERWNSKPGALTGIDCPKCLNRGHTYRYDEELGEIITVPCDCLARRKALKRIENAGLGDQLESKTFGAYQEREPWQAQAKQIAIDYAKNPKGWMYIGGMTGGGKTHLCTAALRYLARTHEIAYMEWVAEADRLKATTFDQEGLERIEYLQNVPVLYIDDLFKKMDNAPLTPGDFNLADKILFHRYNKSGLLTIISSEKYLQEIMEMDGALGGRIYERSREHIVKVEREPGNNWRLRE